jgi:hypothetical protein
MPVVLSQRLFAVSMWDRERIQQRMGGRRIIGKTSFAE